MTRHSPAVVQERARVGDREGDTVSGKDHKGHLVTLVDRYSAFLLALPMLNRKAETTLATIQKAFAVIPTEARRTLTLDNGKEFAKAAEMEETLQLTTYFAHPHSPWERGLNENTNGLLRKFLPKGHSLLNVSEDVVHRAVWLLKTRLRKRLGWRTPEEIFDDAVPDFTPW